MKLIRRASILLVVPAAFVALLSACGSSSSGGADTTTQGGAGGSSAGGGTSTGGSTSTGGGTSTGGMGAGGSAPTCTESGDLDVEGLWAARVVLDVALQSAPGGVVAVCPTNQHGAAELLVLFEIKQSGTMLTAVTPHVCNFSLPSVTGMAGGCVGDMQGSVTAQVSASDALAATLPALVLPTVTGKLGGTTPGSTFEPDRVDVVLGSKVGGTNMAHWLPSSTCDNVSAPMGTDATCATMCVSDCGDAIDQDADMNPGVTVTVCGQADEAPGAMCHPDDPMTPGWTLQGKAFLNFLVDPLLNGIAASSCVINGSNVDANISYDVIGGNVWLSGLQISVGDIINAIPTFQVLPKTSVYKAVRVDGKHGTTSWNLDLTDLKAACGSAAKQAKSGI